MQIYQVGGKNQLPTTGRLNIYINYILNYIYFSTSRLKCNFKDFGVFPVLHPHP